MIHPRFSHVLLVAMAVAAVLAPSPVAVAIDVFFDNSAGTGVYGTATNWSTNTVPRAVAPNHQRAVIGTDSASGLLNASATLPSINVSPAGIALGIRERDVDGFLVNPYPGDGVLTGSLTITGTAGGTGTFAIIASTDLGQVDIGADGRLLVGVDGRGYYTQTGGNVTARGLVVGGENNTTGLGTSLVSLSGNANLSIEGITGVEGLANFGRRVRVEGPNVVFNSQRNMRLETGNTLIAVITSATAHSPLKTSAAAIVNGSLFVEFSGAGATHSLGQTWDLIHGSGGVTGNFTNLLPGGDVQVSGVTTASDDGKVYRIKKVAGTPTKLQLAYDSVLVLEVDRASGSVKINNPNGGDIDIDSYTVSSARGSLLAAYHGISGTTPTPPDANWVKLGSSTNYLSEHINNPADDDDVFELQLVPSVALGTGFDRDAVGDNIANFGNDGEDLIFTYSSPFTGAPIRGEIKYIESVPTPKFENNLVLRVDPETGVARLKNDSKVTIKIDGFDITSTASALSGAGFAAITGGTGTWVTDVNGTTGLAQLNFTEGGSRTLTAGEEVSIGDISALVNPFDSTAERNGLSMNFILAEGLTGATAAGGDYNNDGVTDAADYTVWRNNLGQPDTALLNRDLANADTNVNEQDYTFWVQNYGATGGPPIAEGEPRVGSIFFDSTLSPGGGGGGFAAAVPEPGTGLMLMLGTGTALFVRRGSRLVRQPSSDDSTIQSLNQTQLGASIMSRRTGLGLSALVALVAVIGSALPASAVTQGIPLTNFDMELPGPLGTKVIAFEGNGIDGGGTPNGLIPGWTFTGGAGGAGEINLGLGNETFGHTGADGNGIPNNSRWINGDSGTEGGGNTGNEMLLSTLDGKAYQVSAFNIAAIPVTQQYKISFDAHDIFTVDENFDGLADSSQLTVRVTYGASRLTLVGPTNFALAGTTNYEILIPSNSPALLTGAGQAIGIEFDVTSKELNPLVAHGWAGIDNVVMEITGLTPGDLNGDGVVTMSDSTNLLTHMKEYSPFEAHGELTGDNNVDLADFRVLKDLISAATGAGGGGLAGGTSIPEPSTWMLFLLAAGSCGSFLRRRINLALPKALCLMAVVGAMLAATAASGADLLHYDPYFIAGDTAKDNDAGHVGEYTANATLVGQNGGTGATPGTPQSFFSGAWFTTGTANRAFATPNGINYLGSDAPGGASWIDRITPTITDTNARVGRNLAVPWTNATEGTYFMSFVVNFGAMLPTNLEGDMGYRAIEFHGSTNNLADSNLSMLIGYNSYFSNLGSIGTSPVTARMSIGNGAVVLENSPDSFNLDGISHLIVVKFSLSATNNSDTISVYLDPTSIVAPELASGTLTGQNFTLGNLGPVNMFGSDGNTDMVADEMRISKAADNTPEEIAAAFALVIPALPLPGDCNGDDVVDILDYNIIAANYNTFTPGGPAFGDVAKADAAQGVDGFVGIADYRLWRDNFNPPGGGGGGFAGAIPEPSALFLVLIAAMAAACGRRSR